MGYEILPSGKARALALMKERDGIEAEMEAISASLNTPGGPGLSGNLVDAEGFPRADIDIAAIRAQRHRLAVLHTDHKVVTSKIEALLHDALAPPPSAAPSAAASSAAAATTITSSVSSPPRNNPQTILSSGTNTRQTDGGVSFAPESAAHDQQNPTPEPSPVVPTTARSEDINENAVVTRIMRQAFALVDQVSENSPASSAGIRVGDEILVLGAVSVRALGSPTAALQALPGLIREHEDRELDLSVARADQRSGVRAQVDLKLTPRRWSGQGLLGCHVVIAPMREDPFIVPEVATAVAERAATGSHGRGLEGHYAD